MKPIDETILHFCGIYQQPEISEAEKKRILKKKRELETLTGLKIERVYVYGENYWGKKIEEDKIGRNLCFLVDERMKTIDKVFYQIKDYALEKNDSNILFWSLCQFEKRKQSPEELDYYIFHYGKLIYDSGKEVEINENIYTTQYAATMNYFNYIKTYLCFDKNDIMMADLMAIYLLKIGYYTELRKLELPKLVQYIQYVNEDKKVDEILKRYQHEKNETRKTQIYHEFEEYIKQIKQIKIQFKLVEEPTMKVYEKQRKKWEEQGTLDLNTLTKEDTYIMYIIQHKNTFEIAELYNVSTDVIMKKRNNWKIKAKEQTIIPENIREIEQKISEIPTANRRKLAQEQMGILSFEKCLEPILQFMKLGEVYLLKEFWKFTQFEKTSFEQETTGGKENTWYRATLAMEFLKDNELVEEVDFKKYKITKKGRKVVKHRNVQEENNIDFEFLVNTLGVINVFGVAYTNDNISEIHHGRIEPIKEVEKLEEIKQESRNENKKEEIDIAEQIQNIQKIEYTEKETGKSNRKTNKIQRKRDYVQEEKNKTEFGKRCEEIIFNKEKQDLIQQGRIDLAKQVEWTSEEKGDDSQGYDIISFRKIGNHYEKIYIEVKGTNKDYNEPFDISIKEVEASEKYQDHYYLYRIAKANTKYPVYYEQKGKIRDNYQLEPVKFKAKKKE